MKFPNESPEYRSARDALLKKEIELRRLTELVAQARRALPPGGELPKDYVFEGANGKTPLSQLFGRHNTLAIYSYMFGPERKRPCPMCTALLDGLDAAYPHLSQRMSLVAIGEAPLNRLLDFKRERGWRHLPLVSANGTRYNYDYRGKDEQGEDGSKLNVFSKADGKIRHVWASELMEAPADPDQDPRGVDLLNPIYMMLDLTPEGRGDFYTKLEY